MRGGSFEDLLEKLDDLKRILRVRATNDPDGREGDADRYLELRTEMLSHPLLSGKMPRFLKTCRTLDEFWPFVKGEFGTYAERRTFIQAVLEPAYEMLEARLLVPLASVDASALASSPWERVQEAMLKLRDRQVDDPEGTVTVARTLLETVCKHILEERGVPFGRNLDLAEIYRLTAEQLNLSPTQHAEQVFKKILGGSLSVVDGLASVRNTFGDAHGKGRAAVRPAPRHAILAANLALAISDFLMATHKEKR